MISSVVVVGALAALARAVPVQERAVTVTEVADVYTTVYEDAAPTTTSSVVAKWWWKGGHRKSSTSVAPVSTIVVSESAAATTSASSAAATISASSYSAAATSSISTLAAAVTTSPAPTSYAAATSTSVYVPPAATTSSSTAAAAPTTASTGSSSNSYAQAVTDHHNAHRANHSAPALVWDDSVAATAMKIAQTCIYEHNTKIDNEDNKNGYGQNIAAGCPADNVTSVITELFYNNEAGNFANLYGQATPAGIDDAAQFDGWGHFTQIVWKGTSKVGCATYDCTGKGNGPKGLGNVGSDVAPIFTVCNYISPGNFIGEFDTNVGKPLGHPTIHWNTLS